MRNDHRSPTPGCTGILLALLPAAGLAHHSLAASYDREGSVSLTGTIVEVRWVNPHALVYIEVAGSSGDVVRWRVEMDPPHALDGRGIDSIAFGVGTEATVTGHPSLDCSASTVARTIGLFDGRIIEVTTDSSWNWMAEGPVTPQPPARRADCEEQR